MLSLTSLLLSLPLLAQGRVVLTDGTSLSGKITSATTDEIHLEIGGEDRALTPDQVLRLDFGTPGGLVGQAESFLAKQDFQNAVNLFGEAATADGEDWIAPFAQLRRAEALLQWAAIDSGRAGESVQAFRDWVASHPHHYWVWRARIGLALALAHAGKVDDGATEMQELANFVFEKNLGMAIEFEARLTRSRVYLIGDKATLAKQRLDGAGGLVAALKKAAEDTSNPSALRAALHRMWQESQILLGDAIEQSDGLDGAAAYWQRLLGGRAPLGPDARAAGQITIANAARAKGKLREAQFALAEVAAILNTSPDTAARTLYALGEVCEELDNKPTPGKVYFQRVIDRYPGSSWAVKARRKLGL